MFRALVFVLAASFTLSALAGDDVPSNNVSAKATRTGTKVLVEMSVTYPSGPQIIDGQKLQAATTASPKITLDEGKRATMIMGSPKPDKKDAGVDDLDSGIRIDVVSVKGEDKAIVTATLVKDGLITWADSKTIDVDVNQKK